MMRVLKYDFHNLPELPFHVYFLDDSGRVAPKKIYIVTRKKIEVISKCIQLYIPELGRYIILDNKKVVPVAEFFVN